MVVHSIFVSKEPNNPAVQDIGCEVRCDGRIFPFFIEIIPELKMREAFVSLSELLQNRLQLRNVLLQFPIHIILIQTCKFGLQSLPILQSACHVNFHYSTTGSFTGIIEVFLEPTHNDCRRKEAIEVIGGGEIALKFVDNSSSCTFVDLDLHSIQKLVPVFLSMSFERKTNSKLLLSFMGNECFPQLFRVVLYILGKPQKNSQPYLIWFHFQIAMVHIGFVESIKEPSIGVSAQWSVLFVSELCPFYQHSIDDFTFSASVLEGVFQLLAFDVLDGDGSVALEFRRQRLDWRLLAFCLTLSQLFPYGVKEGHVENKNNQSLIKINAQEVRQFHHFLMVSLIFSPTTYLICQV